MKNISIWKDTVKKKNYPMLDGDREVDVLIIGGGITGISTLYHLRNSDLKVMLLEQNKIGMSTTGNSTGKLSYLQNDLLDKIRTNFDDKVASKYLYSQKDAIEMIVHTIKTKNIDCDLERVDSYLYTNKYEEISILKDLETFLKKNRIDVKETRLNLVKSKYAIKVEDTYMYHPIKFLYGLLNSNSYPIYENTSIQKIENKNNIYSCYTKDYKIKAKYVVIASHYPYFIFPYLFPLKASLEKSYLSASKKRIDSISLISYSNPFISIRNYKNNMIYLSNSHSLDKNICDRKNYEELMKKLEDLQLKPDYLWSNIDVMTNDGLPYIGKIKDNLLIGTGYNTWGLTNGFLAGKILSDIILDKRNRYIKLFSPKRMNKAQLTGVLESIYKNVNGYVNGYFYEESNIISVKKNGKKAFLYRDGKKEYEVYQNCPHVGCKVVFNEVEKTWDCPCHGSRFSLDGKCINGPSNKDISIEDNQ